MLIETTLHEVPGKGVGLFTAEDIVQGQLIYKDDLAFDRLIPAKILETYPKPLIEFVQEHAAYYKDQDAYYLCCDNARFWNHSDTPNTKYSKETGEVIALETISKGQELTSDYREFCDNCKEGDFGFKILE